jgi:hypothetical protein
VRRVFSFAQPDDLPFLFSEGFRLTFINIIWIAQNA